MTPLDSLLEPTNKLVAGGKARSEKLRELHKGLVAAVGKLESVLYTARRLHEQGIDPKQQLDAAQAEYAKDLSALETSEAAFQKAETKAAQPVNRKS